MSARRHQGFTLLPVVVAMTIVGAVAFLTNRANALNAEISAGRADRERARYAAEAGLQAVNFAIQRLACAGAYPTAASPVADAAFNGGAYSAYASAASGSPLTLTSTGTYNSARVTLTRANAYAYQAAVRTYVYQPNAAVGVDTWLDSVNSGQNRGTDEELAINGPSQESLLRFDLSFFPPGSRVVSQYDILHGAVPGATLEIFKTGSGTGSSTTSFIDAHVVSRAGWTEGNGTFGSGATWDTYDGTNTWLSVGPRFDPRVIARAGFQSNSGWQTIDVTDAVGTWMSPGYLNSGVLLRSSPAGLAISGARYVSGDTTSNPSRRPKLTINYLLPCGAIAPA